MEIKANEMSSKHTDLTRVNYYRYDTDLITNKVNSAHHLFSLVKTVCFRLFIVQVDAKNNCIIICSFICLSE